MKLLGLKKESATIEVEEPDDFWTLSQLINSGDKVRSKTTRKIKLNTEGKASVVKKTVTLTIAVEKLEWSDQGMRISGPITSGPEDIARGSPHVIKVETHQKITIIKERWPRWQLKKLKEATTDKPTPILICVFDREEARFALLKKYGYQLLGTLQGDVQRKRIKVPVAKNFFAQLGEQLDAYDKRYKLTQIILASPSFWKEELFKVWRSDTRKKVIQATCSGAGENAINEVLKRPETKSALDKQRAAKETIIVEEVFAQIAKDGKVSYGMQQVTDAVAAGAVEKLIVTDALISRMRKDDSIIHLEQLMQAVDNARGDVVIISTMHQAGARLDGLGGVSALLRYQLH